MTRETMVEYPADRNKWRDLTDGELARRITRELGRCPDAEAEFYVRFARRIRLYGLRHLGGEDAARDLSHDVIILSLQKLRRGEVREPEKIASRRSTTFPILAGPRSPFQDPG